MRLGTYKVDRWLILGVGCVILLSFGCTFLNALGVLDADIEIESALMIWIFSAIVFCCLLPHCSQKEAIILVIGYITRVFLVYFDVYGKGIATLPSSGGDSERFWRDAKTLYYTDIYRGTISTNYPYVIKAVLGVFGENRVLAQYMNVLCWLITVYMIWKISEILGLSNRVRVIGTAILTFAPMNILLSALLLRDNPITMLNAIGVYYTIKWMKADKLFNILKAGISVLLASLLHSGSIALLFAIIFMFVFYNAKKQDVVISITSVLGMGIMSGGLIVLYCSGFLKPFMNKIPKLNSLFAVQNKLFLEAGANYLRDLPYTENIIVFAIYTAVRYLYFFLSPMPWDMRGMSDLLSFVCDSLPHAIAMCVGIYVYPKSRRYRSVILFCLISIFLSGILFAWGVSNAGTALRHRAKLIGIEITLFMVCMDEIRGYRKRAW